MKSFLVALGILVSLSVAYILAYRVNNKDKKKQVGCTSGCEGCKCCAIGQSNEK